MTEGWGWKIWEGWGDCKTMLAILSDTEFGEPKEAVFFKVGLTRARDRGLEERGADSKRE